MNLSYCLPDYWKQVGFLHEVKSAPGAEAKFRFQPNRPYNMPQGAMEMLQRRFPGTVFNLTPRINGMWTVTEGCTSSRGVLAGLGIIHRDPLRWIIDTAAREAIARTQGAANDVKLASEAPLPHAPTFDAGEGTHRHTPPPATDETGKA